MAGKNLFGGGALKQLENTHLEEVKTDKGILEQEPKPKKDKPSEPKPAAATKQKASSLQADFKSIQKGKGTEKTKKLVSIPKEYDNKVNEMIKKGECESFTQLINFLLDKFFES